MEIDQRIPDLSDTELERLHTNALRLSESGTSDQQRQSERLLPLVDTALEKRRLARAAKRHAKRGVPASTQRTKAAQEPSMNEIEAAIEAAGFGAFAKALATSGCGAVLADGKPYTIFAPTDAAFKKITKNLNAALLRTVIGYHFAAGKVLSQRFVGKRIRAATHAGGTLLITDKDGLHVNKAKLVRPDIIIGVCVLHGIDQVLSPPVATKH